MRKYFIDIPRHYLGKIFHPMIERRALRKRQALYAGFVQAGSLVFDVGANVGNRIDAILGLGARVVAVEPQEACYLELERRFGQRIELVKKGLAETEGVRKFYLSDASTISSFSTSFIESVRGGRFKHHQWTKTVEVEMTTLDHLVEHFGKPAFIKIDVEGYESEVLRGLHQVVPAISYEYCVPEQLEKALICLELIAALGGSPECNYSVGESMVFALPEWVSVEEMKTLMAAKKFIASSFGDIYVRQRSRPFSS